MESKLKFSVTLVNGDEREHEISVRPPEDPSIPMEAAIMEAINQMFAQFSQIGAVKKEGDVFTLIPAHQIAKVTVVRPAILIAGVNEAPSTKLFRMP